jgi:hypothetical protein
MKIRSPFQCKPNGTGTSHSATGEPPAMGTLRTWLFDQNATHVPSGENVGSAGSTFVPLEAFAELRIGGEVGRQDLDRHRAIEARVARLVDLAHAAGASERDDFVRPESRTPGQRLHSARIISPY